MFSAQSIAAYLFFLVTIHEYFLSFADAACYLPNGQEAVGDTPCNPNGDSICCPGDAGASVCLSNGLCFVPSQNVIARSSCTDQSWSSSACTPYCKNELQDQFCQLTPCLDTSFCCGIGPLAADCCNSQSGFYISEGDPTNMQGGGTTTEIVTETVTDTATSVQTETETETETQTETTTLMTEGSGQIVTTVQTDTETTTQTQTETMTTTFVTQADGGIFSSTKVETSTSLVKASTCSAGSVTNQNSSSSASCPNCSSKQVAVGVGVGIPLAVALLGSLIFLFRRRNKVPLDQTVTPMAHQFVPVNGAGGFRSSQYDPRAQYGGHESR